MFYIQYAYFFYYLIVKKKKDIQLTEKIVVFLFKNCGKMLLIFVMLTKTIVFFFFYVFVLKYTQFFKSFKWFITNNNDSLSVTCSFLITDICVNNTTCYLN